MTLITLEIRVVRSDLTLPNTSLTGHVLLDSDGLVAVDVLLHDVDGNVPFSVGHGHTKRTVIEDVLNVDVSSKTHQIEGTGACSTGTSVVKGCFAPDVLSIQIQPF